MQSTNDIYRDAALSYMRSHMRRDQSRSAKQEKRANIVGLIGIHAFAFFIVLPFLIVTLSH